MDGFTRDSFTLVRSVMTSEPYIRWIRPDGSAVYRRLRARSVRGLNRALQATTNNPMGYRWRIYPDSMFTEGWY
jgi:hypothetical protein